MELEKKETKKKKSLLWRIGKVLAWVVASLIFLVILILILIQTSFVQNFARKKVISYLENKLKTKVAIGKLDIKFPTALSLQHVFFEDQSKDTLLYGGELKVDIDMLGLIRKNISINEIALNDVVVKVKRLPPDSVFNFQFIVDAFSSGTTDTTQKQDTSSLKINIDRILVNKTRIVYKDLFTGNDMDLAIGHFDTKISTFDPTHLIFNFPSITLDGLKGHFYQLNPLKEPVEKTNTKAGAQPENVLRFLNKEIRLSNIDVAYNSDPSDMKTSFKIGDAEVHPKNLDLKNMIFSLNDASLINSDIVIETAASGKVPVVLKDTSSAAISNSPGMKIMSDAVSVKNLNLNYDDNSAPKAPSGMDYSHLELQKLSIDANGLLYNSDSIIASIKSAGMKEKTGFVLNNMRADFSMTPTGIYLNNLLIQTPGTELKNKIAISYKSSDAIKKNIGDLGLYFDLQQSKIAMSDIWTFVPQLKEQTASLSATSTLYIDAKITGKVSNLNIQSLRLKGLTATDINVTGGIKGLPDSKKLNVDLAIQKFQTSREDILSLVPKNTIPDSITLPESILATGIIRGGMNDLHTGLAVYTSLGDATLTASLKNITDKHRSAYDIMMEAKNLQLGKLMQDSMFGPVTANFKLKGSGFDPQTANASFDGNISSITLNKYKLHDIKAKGSIADEAYKLNASVVDSSLTASIDANGIFAGKYPTVKLSAMIDSIKTMPLHFTTQPFIYHGKIDADFSNINPDSLEGNLAIKHSVLVNNGKRITVDSVIVVSSCKEHQQLLSLKTDFFSASIKGTYKLTELGSVFQQAIDPYFAITDKKDSIKTAPYHFTVNGGISPNPALKTLLPDLNQLKPIILSGNFASDSGWNLMLGSPHIDYGTSVIDSFNFVAGTRKGGLEFNTSVKRVISGSSISLYDTRLDGTLKNNKLDFALNIKDQDSKDKYSLSGSLDEPTLNKYVVKINPDRLLLNYEKWQATSDNKIQYFNGDVNAHNLVLSRNGQKFSITSSDSSANAPLKIDFKDFSISTLTAMIRSDSLIVNGTLNGNAIIKNIQTQPTFTTDITIDDLSIYKDTIGNFTAKVNNELANTFQADLNLTGRGNNMNIKGTYKVDPVNSSFDLAVNIDKLQMKVLEGLSDGGIKDAQGFIYGKVALKGTFDKPNIDGKIQFDNTSVNVSKLNNVFKIDNEAIAIISNKGIVLNKFSIRDAGNQPITIDGAINTTDFLDYGFDLKIHAQRFQAINSTSKDNELFYGKLIFSTNLTVKGSPTHPIIDGNLTINDKTDFTVVLPQSGQGIESHDGIVRFVDKSAPIEDSLFMKPYDSLKTTSLFGYDISLNIHIEKEAVFKLIVDVGNGDYLQVRGNGQLTAGVDISGKTTLTGNYEIEDGSYNFSFNVLKRQFKIQKGSNIVWTGDPTAANIDITAIYIADAAPYDLVQAQTKSTNEANTYKQKLPFEVNLILKGDLVKPAISFDIRLPKNKNYGVSDAVINTVEAKLDQLRQDPGEMNKQVFALLLLNRFVGENPFDNGGEVDPGSYALQSVSSLLTAQLNQLAAGLVHGVDINFDLNTIQDYSSGTEEDRTNLNVGVSKSLLKDRLTVTVGSDFELSGATQANQQAANLAGDVSVNYKLSEDGKYMIRVYRQNDYEYALQGYVIETGVAFSISVDYDKFSQIFLTAEQRRKKKQMKKDNRKMEKAKSEKTENN
jgi:translocation and assembly module TamB